MVKYALKKLALAIPTLLIISLVIFTVLAIAPGDPMGEFATNPAITPEIRENIRRSLGLDQPLPVRYYKWLWSLLQGDLGYSFTSRSPVLTLLAQRLPTTLWVVGSAYLLALGLALPLGIISAVKRSSWLDQIITTAAFIGFSLPTFFTGIIFIVIFSVWLQWFPFIYNSTLEINSFSSLVEQIKQSIMPVVVLALYQCATLMRFVRSSILEELHQDYVRTAYSKGLSLRQVIKNHVIRNAFIPVVTLVALDIPKIFTGALITEQVFRVPGIGALLIESINRSDTPVVMAITFIYAILIVLCSLVADLIYGYLDPRVKY